MSLLRLASDSSSALAETLERCLQQLSVVDWAHLDTDTSNLTLLDEALIEVRRRLERLGLILAEISRREFV